MNAADLRDVLDERSSATSEDIMHHLRLYGVRARIRRRRRRRAVAWSAAVLLVLAGVGGLAVRPWTGHGDLDGGPAAATVKGFPEYAYGTRVVAAEVATLPTTRRLELTLVPEQDRLAVFTRCTVDEHIEVAVAFRGVLVFSGGCESMDRATNWVERGLRVGEPNTFVLTVTAGVRGEFGLAVGAAVPFADYPLPSRPARLNPLPGLLPAACTVVILCDQTVIRSHPADPLRPAGLTVPAATFDGIEMVSQTPGLLHVRIDDELVDTGEWWDYAQDGYHVAVPDAVRAGGQDVTIQIVPQYVTGAWFAAVRTKP